MTRVDLWFECKFFYTLEVLIVFFVNVSMALYKIVVVSIALVVEILKFCAKPLIFAHIMHMFSPRNYLLWCFLWVLVHFYPTTEICFSMFIVPENWLCNYSFVIFMKKILYWNDLIAYIPCGRRSQCNIHIKHQKKYSATRAISHMTSSKILFC